MSAARPPEGAQHRSPQGGGIPARFAPSARIHLIRWRAVAGLLGLSMFAATAGSMSLRELRALELSDKAQGPNYVQYYLVGVLEGALEAQSHAVRAGARPLFCVNGRRLEPRMAKPLFDTELKRNSALYEADMPVQLVMLNALATAYTC
jgi:hypothetical protein